MGLVLDCHDPEALAPFWEAALGYVTLGAVENYVLLMPDARPGPKWLYAFKWGERIRILGGF